MLPFLMYRRVCRTCYFTDMSFSGISFSLLGRYLSDSWGFGVGRSGDLGSLSLTRCFMTDKC